jgi:leader peptidase (prepilin peptidase)/N-methyltransferase
MSAAGRIVPAAACAGLLGIAASDLAKRKIPNILLIAIAAAGILENYRSPAVPLLVSAYFFTAYYAVYKSVGGMGFGDVKLAGVLSFLLGFRHFMAAALAGTSGAMLYGLASGGKHPASDACQKGKSARIPYGTFIAMSAFVSYIMKELKR